MECRDAQFHLRLSRPGTDDLDADVRAALDRHLAACPACAAEARHTAAFDAAVATAMRAVPVPEGLRTRLLARAAGRRRVVVRRRVLRFAAAAAAVLVAVGIAVGVFSATRPQPDTLDLAMRGDALAVSLRAAFAPVDVNDAGTDPRAARANEDAVRRWLKADGLPADLPEPFDYGLLLSHHWEDVQGRPVPVVWFRERGGAGFAKVYVFRSTRFDLKAISDAQSSYCLAKAYPDPAAGITYVVLFTGQDLGPFLRTHGGQVARRLDTRRRPADTCSGVSRLLTGELPWEHAGSGWLSRSSG